MRAPLAILFACLALSSTALAADVALAGDPASACANADALASQISIKNERTAITCLLNVERAQQGVRPLKRNKRLTRAATGHSREMVRNSYFDHQRPGGGPTFVQRVRHAGYMSGHASWTVGENLAWGAGARSTPRAIVRSWMQSGEHRENLLDRSFKQVGIGAVRGTPEPGGGYSSGNGLSDSLVVTADFGAHN